MALDRSGCCDDERKPCSYHEGVEDALGSDTAGGLDGSDRGFRMAVVSVLIEHMLNLDERRQQRTETTWPDESDIYTMTVIRLRVLFKKKLQDEGWTPPPKGRKKPTPAARGDQ